MNKLFLHHPLFRLLSPVFSGVIVYLLILLINNNVEQLQEHFLGQELYVCIGLAYLTQEFSRLSLILFEKIKKPESYFLKILFQIVISIILCIVIVSTAIYFYFKTVLGYTPNFSELTLFNSIFSCFGLIYISLYLSHQFLYKINTKKIEDELINKRGVEEDFRQFKKGINPNLLFESFESLIVLMNKNKEHAEEFIDHLSVVYRYILSGKNNQLAPITEEIRILKELIALFNHLPFRQLTINVSQLTESLVVPGSLLIIVENIIRSTIISPDLALEIEISETNDSLLITYLKYEKITSSLDLESFEEINTSYKVYTDKKIFIKNEGKHKVVGIPLLKETTEEIPHEQT